VVEGAIAASGQSTIRFYRHPKSDWGTIDRFRDEQNLVPGESVPIDVAAVDFAELLSKSDARLVRHPRHPLSPLAAGAQAGGAL
jgi:hypothetical protein